MAQFYSSAAFIGLVHGLQSPKLALNTWLPLAENMACRYGFNCLRYDCWFEHPQAGVVWARCVSGCFLGKVVLWVGPGHWYATCRSCRLDSSTKECTGAKLNELQGVQPEVHESLWTFCRSWSCATTLAISMSCCSFATGRCRSAHHRDADAV